LKWLPHPVVRTVRQQVSVQTDQQTSKVVDSGRIICRVPVMLMDKLCEHMAYRRDGTWSVKMTRTSLTPDPVTRLA